MCKKTQIFIATIDLALINKALTRIKATPSYVKQLKTVFTLSERRINIECLQILPKKKKDSATQQQNLKTLQRK